MCLEKTHVNSLRHGSTGGAIRDVSVSVMLCNEAITGTREREI